MEPKVRKRAYRTKVKCSKCHKEFFNEYKSDHLKRVHNNDTSVKFVPVVDSKQAKLSFGAKLDHSRETKKELVNSSISLETPKGLNLIQIGQVSHLTEKSSEADRTTETNTDSAFDVASCEKHEHIEMNETEAALSHEGSSSEKLVAGDVTQMHGLC